MQRKLGLWAAMSIVVGSIIGSSIFMKPATMAAQLGSPFLLLWVWIIAGLVSMIGGMINAEIGSSLPHTGGQYVYFRYMYGDFFAYLYGWACFIVINTAAIAGIAFVFAQYTEYFIHLPRFSAAIEKSISFNLPFIGRFYIFENAGVKMLAMLLIILLTWINVRSVKAAGSVQVLLSVIKVGALIFLAGAIFIFGKGHTTNLVTAPASFHPPLFELIAGFIAATTGALAAYDGWNNLGYIAGEIKQPQKNIPKGLIGGIAICILLYVITTEAYLYMIPVDEMKHSPLVASDALKKILGFAGGGLIAALVIISTAGATNGNIMPCARVMFAMSEEKRFFGFAGKLSSRFETPANALYLQAIWGCALVLIGSFDMMMDMFVFITWIFYGFGAYGIYILRRKMPDAERPYKMNGYKWLPYIFLLFAVIYIGMTIYTDVNNFRSGKTTVINSVFGLVLTAIGIPLYWYFKRKRAH